MPLLVEDLMSRLTKSVMPETSIGEVISLMMSYHVECLPVADNKSLVGYVRLKDIYDILYAADAGISTEASKRIGSLQSSNAAIARADIRRVIFDKAVSVPPSLPANKAMSIMQRYRVSSLAVTEADELIGMVSLEDISRAITGFHSARAA